MAKIAEHSLEQDGGLYRFLLDATEREDRIVEFDFVVREIKERREETQAIQIRFNAELGRASFAALTLDPVSIYLMCLVGCGLNGLIDDIIDCWKNGNRTPNGLIACMRAKGKDIPADWAKCATKCLMPWR